MAICAVSGARVSPTLILSGSLRRIERGPRRRRLNGDLRGLGVADLADHDLVRVVAQDGAEAAREREPLLLVDRNLRDPAELVLDRVFDRDDLVFDRLDLGQRRVERGRLAAAGRTG